MNKYLKAIFIIAGVIALLIYLRSNGVNKLITTISSGKNVGPSLKKTVDEALVGAEGNYGIVVKNLKTNETFMLNGHQSYEPGSLYKLWVMAEAFNQIESGSLKTEEVLSQDVKILNSKFAISSDSAELKEGSISLSVDDALKQMIQISHNYAALLLTDRIRLSNVAKFLQKHDFKQTSVGTDGSDPVSTPFDIALFFEKLYKGQLASPANTVRMLDLLKNQQLNNKLPKYLPENTIIAHKTGEIDYYTHDAGIIYLPSENQPDTAQEAIIIVILSSSDYPPGAEDRIAQVSKAVYEYFENR